MKLVFNRTYVTQKNVGYIKGMEVPEEFDPKLVDILLDSGIVKIVESPQAFMEKMAKKARAKTEEVPETEILDEVEALNPERKPRSK